MVLRNRSIVVDGGSTFYTPGSALHAVSNPNHFANRVKTI